MPNIKYLTGKQLRLRYGDRGAVWLWRRLKTDPEFPRPILIGRNHFFDLNEVEAYEARQRLPLPSKDANETPDGSASRPASNS